jgi:predicted dehydrogenase
MNIAILGCGYVADFYMQTLRQYPNLSVVSAYDKDEKRLPVFPRHYGIRRYSSLEEILADSSIEMVLNLTNPRSHFELTKSCLLAGKHVYSEKPLAMDSIMAGKLVELAKQKGLRLAIAPCSLLSETCQTIWKALHEGAIGPVRLVYANFDNGMIHRLDPMRWRSASGAEWPAWDEFEVGCTYERAEYVLSWLAAFFGPAQRVTAFSSCQIGDKGITSNTMAPDFSVGCIEYKNDVLARVTCSVLAPSDKSLLIVGDNGVLYTKYVRNDASPVYIATTTSNRIVKAVAARLAHLGGRVEHLLGLPWSVRGLGVERKVKFAIRPKLLSGGCSKPVDFMRGPNELAESIREGRPCRLRRVPRAV